jgi:hypothetical protein
VIIAVFQSKPQDTYPSGSQLYHRSKMYEPHLDVKYLLQYKEFKLFAIATAFLLTAVNVCQAVPVTFIFPEASANRAVINIAQVWAPLVQIAGVMVSAFVLATFSQTNAWYKNYLMLLISGFAGSIVLLVIAFMSNSPGFYAFALIVDNAVIGALKLYLYEFMTEIIFPVSPVFGLAILNSLSGLLSLLVCMFSDDIVRKDPLNETFTYIVLFFCIAICLGNLLVFLKTPFKLNRSDYESGRRHTMISSFMQSSGNSHSSDKKKPADIAQVN